MPNTLFISYSRVQQDKAIQLDNIKLMQFYWWMDYRIVGTVDWWKNICEAIEESYCLIALMTKTYTESVYCMGELQYALKLNKPVLCLMLEPGVTYPIELSEKRVQYINMHEWDVNRVLHIILEGMHRVERDYNDKVYHRDISQRPYLRPSVPTPPTKTASNEDREIATKVHNAQNAPAPPVRVGEAIIKATAALDNDDYARVIDLLEPVRPHAKTESDQADIHELLRLARLGQEYAKIAALVQSAKLKARGCEQYTVFRKIYADYPDTANLSAICVPSSLERPAPKPSAPPGDPVQAALERAWTFKGKRNRDWTPFLVIFSDLKIPDIPFCLVPVGAFQMGSNERSNEKPIHQQSITKPYYIAQYPVTNAQWAMGVKAKAINEPDEDFALEWYHDPEMASAPVVGVSWYAARAFASWLGCRLPTEREWEYAARGIENLPYPWGENWESNTCVWKQNSGDKPASVVNNPEGRSWVNAQHLSGNIWEWVNSEYQPYPYNDAREGVIDTRSLNVLRILRGGSWNSYDLANFRTSYRVGNVPDLELKNAGFRLVTLVPDFEVEF